MVRRSRRRLFNLGLISLGVLSVGVGLGLITAPALAQDERTTALVTIAEANAHCLSSTKTMSRAKATDLADRFLAAKQVSASSRQAVTSHSDFEALRADYINRQGGCEALVKGLRR